MAYALSPLSLPTVQQQPNAKNRAHRTRKCAPDSAATAAASYFPFFPPPTLCNIDLESHSTYHQRMDTIAVLVVPLEGEHRHKFLPQSDLAGKNIAFPHLAFLCCLSIVRGMDEWTAVSSTNNYSRRKRRRKL